jgi:tRNA threonylcarbamoyladenosine biosynthesis protein TsaB
MILKIDTTDNQACLVAVGDRQKQFKAISETGQQQVLIKIQELLTENDLALTDITQIDINPGPGSFTGVRVGTVIANGLAQSLHVPVIVNGRVVNQALPVYDRPANITTRRRV